MSDVEVSDKERLLADPDEDDDDDDGASGLSSDYETSSVVSSSGQPDFVSIEFSIPFNSFFVPLKHLERQ